MSTDTTQPDDDDLPTYAFAGLCDAALPIVEAWQKVKSDPRGRGAGQVVSAARLDALERALADVLRLTEEEE